MTIAVMLPVMTIIVLLDSWGTGCTAGLRCSQADGWCPAPQRRRRHVVPPAEQVSCTACLMMLCLLCFCFLLQTLCAATTQVKRGNAHLYHVYSTAVASYIELSQPDVLTRVCRCLILARKGPLLVGLHLTCHYVAKGDTTGL